MSVRMAKTIPALAPVTLETNGPDCLISTCWPGNVLVSTGSLRMVPSMAAITQRLVIS